MPIIYLSPSTQEGNYYVNGGTEEEYMNLLADKMVPYLDASGIRYTRNTPDMTAASSIAASNAGNYDLHLALHSNAAPEGRYGQVRGNHRLLLPHQPARPAGLHHHRQQFKVHLPPAQPSAGPRGPPPSGRCAGCGPPPHFGAGLPRQPGGRQLDQGESGRGGPEPGHVPHRLLRHPLHGPGAQPVRPSGRGLGVLNIRSRPDLNASILAQAPDGAPLTIMNQSGGWYLVNYKGTIGYAKDDFVTLNS